LPVIGPESCSPSGPEGDIPGSYSKWECCRNVIDGSTTYTICRTCERKSGGIECGDYTIQRKNIPSSLRHALDNLIEKSPDITKVPNIDVLQGGNLPPLTTGENETSSPRIVDPQDRFCMDGTGGNTGRQCIPCDPGLRFGVGCIDVLTGGPLETQQGTTEPGKNTTKGPKIPKDLGGSNDDLPELSPSEK